MKHLYFYFVAALLLLISGNAVAQDEATAIDSINGIYRLSTPAYGDDFTAESRYKLTTTPSGSAGANSTITIESKKMYSLLDDMAELNAQLEAGKIDSTTYSRLFQQAMTLNSWKSGCYPLKSFTINGVNYIDFVKKLADYCDNAIEDYLNNESDTIYNTYRMQLLFMAAMSGIIYPKDLASADTFRSWVENLLTQWRGITDFNVYMEPETTSSDDGLSYTGNYYIKYKTPAWIGNLKNFQVYMNNIITGNGSNPTADTLNIWGGMKSRILRQIEKDYPAGSDAYNLTEQLLGDDAIDMVYCIGEKEDGSLYSQPLPDAFGTNGVTLTSDDIQRVVWKLTAVQPTGINAVNTAKAQKADIIYDLQGRRVNTINHKGIYIINGKKVVK